MKPYRVEYWDGFDREWTGLRHDFDDLHKTIAFCNRKQAKLSQGNKDCGEHYGVIDLRLGRLVYCPLRRDALALSADRSDVDSVDEHPH